MCWLIPPALAELRADLLEARRIREDSALWRIPAGMPFVFERMEAPFADLAARVEDSQPGQVYSSRDRSNYRRRLRRLCEARQAQFRSIGPGAKPPIWPGKLSP
jgi:hypothetical protein